MNANRLKFVLGILMLSLSVPLWAMNPAATLSGTVTDLFGSPISNARISVSNVFTGQTAEARSSAQGRYSVPSLGGGTYEVAALAPGFPSRSSRVHLAAGGSATLNLQLEGTVDDAAPGSDAASKGSSAPQSSTASQSSGKAPTLSSLGFPSSALKGNAKEQARLNKRSHMLQIHQKLGMITLAAMIAAIATSSGAKGHHGYPGSPGGRNLHMALGVTTASLYAATAYFALAAPHIHGVKVRGPIRLHKAMAYIHLPGMVMTAILGSMAYSQLSNGERLHGIAKYHQTAALVTAVALGVAVFAVATKW